MFLLLLLVATSSAAAAAPPQCWNPSASYDTINIDEGVTVSCTTHVSNGMGMSSTACSTPNGTSRQLIRNDLCTGIGKIFMIWSVDNAPHCEAFLGIAPLDSFNFPSLL